jgi:hypothetical protein
MTWKRGFAIALCSCALWLYVDRTVRSDDGPPKGDKPPRAHQKHDAPPPGPPHGQRDADPGDEDFDSPGPPPGEFGPPGPPPGDGRMGPPGQPPFGQMGDRPQPHQQGNPGPQGPGNPPPGMMPGMGMPGMPPGGMPGGMQGYGPGLAPGGMPGGKFGTPGWMPNQDPEILDYMMKEANLSHRSEELAEKYRHAGESDRGEIQKQIEKLVSEQFDLRQDRRQKELKRFEDQIKKLRETIEKRQKAKAEIIDRRVKELLGQDEDMRF